MTGKFAKGIILLPNTLLLRGGNVLPEETGKVKWFNEKKGFGMLGDKDGRDVFLPPNIPIPKLDVSNPDLVVAFEAVEKEDPPRKFATSVRVLS